MSGLLQRLEWDQLPKASLYALAGANAIPLAGVIFLGWRVGDIMFLFWFENVIIGVFNIVRMVIASGRGVLRFLSSLPIIAFFTVHYGGFTFVHGIFVFVLFVAPTLDPGMLEAPPAPPEAIEITEDPDTWPPGDQSEMTDEEFEEFLEAMHEMAIETILYSGLWLAMLALAVSHGVSLRTNFIGSGEYLRVRANDLMARPYGRIVLLHVVIIFGGMLVMATGQLAAALVVLVLLKIVLDVGAHLHERMRLGKYRSPASS